MTRKRILFVAMPDSIHAARWIAQLTDLGWDIHLFAATDGLPNTALHNVSVHSLVAHRPKGLDSSVRLYGVWPWRAGANVLLRVLREFALGRFLHALWLALLIRLLKPDIVQSLEFQHAGYLTLAAKPYAGPHFPIWIATNWGSDLFLFSRLSAHVPRIKAVLEQCDYYSCECQRDVELAKQLGMKGHVLPVVPNSGGFNLARLTQYRQPGAVSARRTIVIKGYQHWAGRALVALRAIALCSQSLEGYRIAVCLASNDVKIAAELLAHDLHLQVDLIPPCSHDEMLRLYGSARVYVGLSISDAISTSMLESMAMGAFPIQSCTACADEWIVDGETGFIVPPEDPAVVAEAIRRAVLDDALIDKAAQRNADVVRDRLAEYVVRPAVHTMYERIAR